MKCDAKIRPFPNETELACEHDHYEGDGDPQHIATLRDYAYPGSTTEVHWFESDRLTFRGDWTACPVTGCTLPFPHNGRCAS